MGCLPDLCPRCGRTPKLIDWFSYGTSYSDPSRYWFQWRCDGFLGLRLHLAGEAVAVAKGEWSRPARELAVESWNAAVAEERRHLV